MRLLSRPVLAALALALSGTLLAGAAATAQAVEPPVTAAPAVLGGPLIDHDDVGSSVLVQARGNNRTAAAAEGLQFRHSNYQPTGRFVRAGEIVQFDVPDGPPLRYGIGAVGVYSDLNGGATSTVPTWVLPVGRTEVVAPNDGLVFLESSVEHGDVRVQVTGGAPVPVFVLGETSAEDLTAQLERWPDSRFVTFVGDRVLGDFQRAEVDRTRRELPTWDPVAMVQNWDQVVGYANDIAGLDVDAVGVGH